MFYLTCKPIHEIQLDDPVMVLADFSGIPAGTKGKIVKHYGTGVMVEWEIEENTKVTLVEETFMSTHVSTRKRQDGFNQDELEYLAFGTDKHPTKSTHTSPAPSAS